MSQETFNLLNGAICKLAATLIIGGPALGAFLLAVLWIYGVWRYG